MRFGLSQNSIIAGSIIIAYFVFITVRGELPYYIAVFTGKGTGTPGTSASASVSVPGTVSAFAPTSGGGIGVGISVGSGGGGIGVGGPSTGNGGYGSMCALVPELCDPNYLPPGGFGPDPFGNWNF